MRGGQLPEPERNALAQSLADRAMAQLTRAIDTGHKNPGLLSKDTDLDPLRARPDFQALLERATAEPAPKRPSARQDDLLGCPGD